MTIYSPAEDSYLLQNVLKKLKLEKDLKVLDVGTGSGIQAQTLKKLGIKNITTADINPEAVKLSKKLGFKSIKSNLFSNIPPEDKFDLIVFNPPYLPENKEEPKDSKTETTGGKNGSELINKFLKQARNHLTKEGKIILLNSSLTKKINWLDYKKKKLAEKKLFFERLLVWNLQSPDNFIEFG